jgi:hypothetical protein
LGNSIINHIHENAQFQFQFPSNYFILHYLAVQIIGILGLSCVISGSLNIQIYDIYNSIRLHPELKILFSSWLIPDWIFTGTSDNLPKNIITYSKEDFQNDFENLHVISKSKPFYETKVIDCIYNIANGCLIISQLYPDEDDTFFNFIPILIPSPNMFIQRKHQITGFLFGCLYDKKKVTFCDLLAALRPNRFYPKFIVYLSLPVLN